MVSLLYNYSIVGVTIHHVFIVSNICQAVTQGQWLRGQRVQNLMLMEQSLPEKP